MIAKSVVIIGGGWSGIGVAGCLAYNGQRDFVLLEQTEGYGGFWKNYTYTSVRMHDLSRLYKTPTSVSNDYANRFLTRDEVPEYLRKYAEYFRINEQTKFNFRVTEVINIENDDKYTWEVKGIDNNNIQTIYKCQHLCIATSYCRIPYIPDNLKHTMNEFRGKVIHSNIYKDPSNFDRTTEKKILIIGGGHSSSEIATELYDNGYDVTIAHRGGQYFMKQEDWTTYLNNQTIEKSLLYWKYSMDNPEFSQLLEKFDKEFSEKLYDINTQVNWAIPKLKPATFMICHKKTIIDDPHFIDLVLNKKIKIKGTVEKIVNDGVFFKEGEHEEYGALILCTGFSHGLENFLENSEQYMSNHRYPHLPPEKTKLPLTDGRCKSIVKNNLYFPGFDYGINQRVDFALQSWYVGERILVDLLENFSPELSPSKFS